MRKSRSIRKDSIKNEQKQPDDIEMKRILRHDKLIRAVQNYRRTLQEEEKLLKIRKNTVFEIQLRFKRSDINTIYVFPKGRESNENSEEEEEIFQEGSRSARGSTYYDLTLQNQIIQTRISTELSHMNSARRVKSLDQYSSSQSQPKLVRNKRLETHLENQPQSTKKIKRSNTLNKNMIKLSPISQTTVLKPLKKIESIKTQIQVPTNNQLERIMNRKLITETGLTPIKKPNRMKIRTLVNT